MTVSNEWQDIQNAPKTGAQILLSDNENVWIGHWYKLQDRFTDDSCCVGKLRANPTHWQLLKLPKE